MKHQLKLPQQSLEAPVAIVEEVPTIIIEEAAPIEQTPAEAAPIDQTPVETAPVEAAPVELSRNPAETAPIEMLLLLKQLQWRQRSL